MRIIKIIYGHNSRKIVIMTLVSVMNTRCSLIYLSCISPSLGLDCLSYSLHKKYMAKPKI